MKKRNRCFGTYSDKFEADGHVYSYYTKVWGESYYYPEKRVDGNPKMIESFEESGVNADDYEIIEMFVDDEPVPESELAALIEKYKYDIECQVYDESAEIEWEYPEEDY